MFLFFFLSGYVFKKKESFGEKLKVSAKALLLPYAFWNAAAIIMGFLKAIFISEVLIVKLLNISNSYIMRV